MLRFTCPRCSQALSAPVARRGQETRCPKCRYPVTIPLPEHSLPVIPFDEAEERPEPVPTDYIYESGLLDPEGSPQLRAQMAEDDMSADVHPVREPTIGQTVAKAELPAGERRLPWLIDILLYPVSASGLAHLGIFVGIPVILRLLALAVGELAALISLFSIIVNFVVYLYLAWYVAECVRDSAHGGTRAPEALASAELSQMWSHAVNLIACVLLYWGPALFYFVFAHKTGGIFWALICFGVLFFPMGLLAVTMLDSTEAFNPITLVGSIARTFLSYLGLVLLVALIVVLMKILPTTPSGGVGGFVISVIGFTVQLYFVFVVAHVLGRFYWNNEDRLGWGI